MGFGQVSQKKNAAYLSICSIKMNYLFFFFLIYLGLNSKLKTEKLVLLKNQKNVFTNQPHSQQTYNHINNMKIT